MLYISQFEIKDFLDYFGNSVNYDNIIANIINSKMQTLVKLFNLRTPYLTNTCNK